jgi:hypothetical protein
VQHSSANHPEESNRHNDNDPPTNDESDVAT